MTAEGKLSGVLMEEQYVYLAKKRGPDRRQVVRASLKEFGQGSPGAQRITYAIIGETIRRQRRQ